MTVGCFNRVMAHGLFLSCLLFTVSAFNSANAQPVVPDGNTDTSATVSSDGGVVVDIAPANSGSVSHNTYVHFSIPAAGVTLNNSSVNAETILNEVTSNNPTLIQGALTVAGTPAHVILANPNGITVDGGRFLNNGNVALTTGSISFDDFDRAVSTVQAGEILIGADGLSGAMEELDLIAKLIRINGPVSYGDAGEASHVNIFGGSSVVDFDASRGGGGILPWGMPSAYSDVTSNAVAVDITNAGSLSAGRISVTVTDQGAGVRIAGDQNAAAGGFRLSGSGRLSVNASGITARDAVNIKAGSVEFRSSETSAAVILSAESGVVIETTEGDIDLGAVRISGKTIASDNLSSSGGVTLISEGSIFVDSPAGHRANLESSDDSVVLFSDQSIQLSDLDVSAGRDFRVSATGEVAFSGVDSDVKGDLRILSGSQVTFEGTKATAAENIRIEGSELRFGSLNDRRERTELIARSGGFVARSTVGDVLNSGSLLQGNTAAAGDVESMGGVSIYSAGHLKNRSLSANRLAVIFGDTEGLFVFVSGEVLNETGRLLSNDAVAITAERDIVNRTEFSPGTSPYEVRRTKGRRFASSLWLKRKKITTVSADYGQPLIEGERATILGVKGVVLTGANITNVGADITGANMVLNATGTLRNEARLTGKLEYRQTCRWFCKSSGESDVRSIGGVISSSDSLSVSAGVSVHNLAGTMTSQGSFNISSPLTESRSTFIPIMIETPSGLTGFFRGRRSWLAHIHEWGTMGSFSDAAGFNGDVAFGETHILASGEPDIGGREIELPGDADSAPIGRTRIGLPWNLF